MAFTFRSIDIIIFDIHSAIKPVADSNFLKAAFRFLTDETAYNAKFTSQTPSVGSTYTIRPVKKRDLERNHFWNNCVTKGTLGSIPDFHLLQIPFIFKPLNFDLSIETGDPAFNARAHVFIYLNSLGWASNIRISLTGDITDSMAAAFIGNLRSSGNGLPFRVSGKALKTSDVFKELADIIRNEIYVDPKNVGDNLEVSHHSFISLEQATSPPLFYGQVSKEKSTQLNALMTDSERAQLLSILFGKTIGINEIEGFKLKTLGTWFQGTNFSLTNFGLGTLLFMQEKVTVPSPDIKTVQCMNSNMSTSTLLTLMLRRFHKSANIYPVKTASLTNFLQKTQYSAQLMRANYNNHYFKNFYKNSLNRPSGDDIPLQDDDIPF